MPACWSLSLFPPSHLQGIRVYVCISAASFSFAGSGVVNALVSKAFPLTLGRWGALQHAQHMMPVMPD